MTKNEWDAFQNFRAAFKRKIAVWKAMYPGEIFVYNSDLDTIIEETDIRYIFVGDNPGVQEKEQGRYLAGHSGQICDKFMKERLEIDMANVLVLNKTPIHTPSTMDLKKVNPDALKETQIWMAQQIALLTKVFTEVDLCIFGISHLGKGNLFEPFCEVLKTGLDPIYADKHLYAFKHFSYGQFHGDYNDAVEQGLPYPTPDSIDVDCPTNNSANALDIFRSIGKFHSRNIFGM
ncbi:MAG: uracil-DNA glycosylase family protein [Bacteroidales bacterium]